MLFSGTTPYEVLGIAPGCGLARLREQYRRLAMEHHPDRHTGAGEEERLFHQERFKEVSVAYHVLKDELEHGGEQAPHTEIEPEEWKRRWGRVEKMFQEEGLWSRVGDILRSTLADVASRCVNEVFAARESPDTSDTETEPLNHVVKLPVTLEEIEVGTIRKVRLFLRGMADPVFADVDCSQYPEAVFQMGPRSIRVRMIPREHPVYEVSDLVDPSDLYTTVHISLFDHFFGGQKELVLPSGGTLAIAVPPYFCSQEAPVLSYPGRGIRGHGTLYVSVGLKLPHDAESSSQELSRIYDTMLVAVVMHKGGTEDPGKLEGVT